MHYTRGRGAACLLEHYKNVREITDQIMTETPATQTENTDTHSTDNIDTHVHTQNHWAIVFIGLMILFSWWVMNGYMDFLKHEKCVESHRRNCDPIELS